MIKSKHKYYANPSFLCAKEDGFGEGVRHEIYYCGRRKGCRGEFLPGRKGIRNRWLGLVGVCLQFRPLVSADRQKELRDSQRQEPPSGSVAPRSHRRATSERPRTEVQPPHWGLPSRRLGTPRHPPRPEIGVCPLKGEGVPDVLANPRCGVASGRCPAPRPQPRALLPPPPGPRRNDARSRVWSPGLKRVGGWVRSEPSHSPRDSDLRVGPRFHRRCSRRPSVTSVRAAAAAAAAAESQSQTLALLRSHRRQRSLNSHCSRLLRPARRTLPAPDPPLGPRQLPVPAAPAAPPCSSQPPLANRRRCRRRRQDSDCLRQPGTGWLRPAPRPRPLCTGHAPPGRPAFLRPPAPPPCLAPPPLYRPVAVRAWMCAAAWGRLLCTAGRPLWGLPGGSAFLEDGGGEGGGGYVLTSPSSRESLPPPTPSPLGPEPSFVFLSEGLAGFWGRC